MTSEWMKVMLDEIARKKAEAEQQRLEDERRRAELAQRPADAAPRRVEPPRAPAEPEAGALHDSPAAERPA